MAAGKHSKSRITGNDYIMPQWQRSGATDRIDASATKFEQEKPGVPATSSSVNFKNMETRHNSWTMDTIYNPLTGGARNLLPEPESDKPEVKSLIKRNSMHRSYNILPSSINHSKQGYDIVSGKHVDDLRQVITASIKKENNRFAKRSTVSKFKNIVHNHNLCQDYQRLATTNSVHNLHPQTKIPMKNDNTNTLIDQESRVTAFNRKRLIQ